MAFNIDLEISSDKEDMAFNIDLSDHDDILIGFDFEGVYTGSYEIDPTVNGYTLETANKRMLKDLTVNQIGVSTVDNAQGGFTVTIAGNV